MTATESRVPQMRRIDELCDRFEQDWLSGHEPELSQYLESIPGSEQREGFCSLLAVELELRRGQQQLPDRADYFRRFPQYHQEIVNAFAAEAIPSVPDPPAKIIAAPVDMGSQVMMEVVSGPHAGLQFSFDRHDTFLIGRSARAHLRLKDDPHFSRFHFRLEVNPPVCFLMDLGSRNGTFVNGERVRECSLHSGDVISGGVTEMKIHVGTADQTLLLPPSAKSPAKVPLAMPAAAGPQAVTTPLPVAPAAKRHPTPAAIPAFSEHALIPGYEIEAEIGRGDLGSVYRAVKLATRQTCALKVMTPAVPVAEKMLQMFMRECSILSQLNHPQIVKFLDQGIANSSLYIATEFVPKVDIEDITKRLPLAERVRICGGLMLNILSALDYAHSRSLVHRDIKPGNILITRDKKMLSAKLADFGLAKQYTDAGFSQITRAGDVVGSLPYISPEQFFNSREARPTCDLYSAGATLYSWLTGSTPHDFPADRNQFLVVLEDAPVPIAKRLPKIPQQLAAFLDRALARQPEQRYASAAEMRHALKTALGR